MKVSLGEIAKLVHGTISGSDDVVVRGVASFEAAAPGDITFAVSKEYIKRLDETKANVIIVPRTVSESQKILVRVDNPYLALAKVSTLFHSQQEPVMGISPLAHVGKHFSCGKDVSIYAGVTIGDAVTIGERVVLHAGVFLGNDVKIGNDTVVHANVSILSRCEIGNRVTIQAGSVIGGDGFGYASDGDRYYKIPQTGIVRIDDDVEIGACNAIDRATFGKNVDKARCQNR